MTPSRAPRSGSALLRAGTGCAQCGRDLRPSDTIEVVNVRTGAVRYVCRPIDGGNCFRDNVASRVVDVIRKPSPLPSGDASHRSIPAPDRPLSARRRGDNPPAQETDR